MLKTNPAVRGKGCPEKGIAYSTTARMSELERIL